MSWGLLGDILSPIGEVGTKLFGDMGGLTSQSLQGLGGLSGLGETLKGVGGIYGAINQKNMAKKMLGLQREAFQNQLAMQQRDIARQEQGDREFNYGLSGLFETPESNAQRAEEYQRQVGLAKEKYPNYYGV